MIKAGYITKEVSFKLRGIDFHFSLSQGLFSSADIDSGTRFLLKTLSRVLDEDAAAGRSPPRYVLDAGCGIGVIGICAAAVIMAMGPARQDTAYTGPAPIGAPRFGGVLVRAQDRDELARLITMYNAVKNGIPPSTLETHTEPLLAGHENARWDLILSNIPAKTGGPVLKDFVRRSTGLLNPGGRVIMVTVHTLVDFFREEISAAGAELEWEEKSRREPRRGHQVCPGTACGVPPVNDSVKEKDAEYSVFVFGGKAAAAGAVVKAGRGFLTRHPFYVRASVDCQIEDIPLHIETVHGASGFDQPGGAVLAAAKLIRRIGAERLFPAPDLSGKTAHNAGAPILIHEPGQGFFPCWLLEFAYRKVPQRQPWVLVLSGRNILALEAARHNTEAVLKPAAEAEALPALLLVPAVDLRLGAEALLEAAAGRPYHFIAVFPELLPPSSIPKEADQFAALWEALAALLTAGGVFIAGFSSTEAERFERKKLAGFTRLEDIKRKGFRALGYKRR
ncbi:MAG: methyltransferase [Treponema sp.]|nr:methyltransferase [Treponema sp.]